MKYEDCIFGFLYSWRNSPALQPCLDPHTIRLDMNSLKSWVSHDLKQRRQGTDLCNCLFLLLTQPLLCVPFPHRFSGLPAPPFSSGWDCLRGLTGICSMPWARSGLQCFFPSRLNLPFLRELPHVVPGGLVMGMADTLGLKPSFARQEGQKGRAFPSQLLSVLFHKLPNC